MADRHSAGSFFSNDFIVGDFNQSPLRDLILTEGGYPEEHVREVRKLLEPAEIAPKDPTLVKMQKLWKSLFPRINGHRGTPSVGLDHKPAYEQYQAMMSGKEGGYCVQFGETYGLFAAVAGIPIRVVDSNRQLPNGVYLSAHTFTEVYLPEFGDWTYSDMNLNIFSVRDSRSGRFMNTVQLARLHEAGALSGLVATVFKDGRLVDMPYEGVSRFVQRFINHNAAFVYHRDSMDRHSFKAWIDRYIFRPELAYRMYGDNQKHYVKLVAFYGFLLSALSFTLVGAGPMWAALRGSRGNRRSLGEQAGSPDPSGGGIA